MKDLKLATGKNYRNKNGRIKEIVEFDAMNQRFIDIYNNEYSVSGMFMNSPSDEFDLVELVDEPNMHHAGLQKEHYRGIYQIYTNSYGKMPSKIETFTKIAKANFPVLKDESIEIVFFDGISKKGIMGIRFYLNQDTKCPSDYFDFGDYNMLDKVT